MKNIPNFYKKVLALAFFAAILSISSLASFVYADYYNWTAVTSGPSSGWAAVDSSADGTYIHAVTSDLSILIHQFVNGTYSANLGDSDLNSWIDVATSDSGVKAIASNNSPSIMISTNYGATWGEFQPNGSNAAWGKVAVSGDGVTMYAYNSYTGSVWKTTDISGQGWSNLSFYNSGIAGPLGSIDISDDGQCVVMGAASGSWISVATDGGNSGIATEYSAITGSPIIDVAVSNDCTKITIISGGSIFYSPDGGATFSVIGPSGDWQSIDMSSDGTVMAAAAQSTGVYVSYNGGVNWQLESGAPSGLLRDIKLNSTGNRITLASSNSYIYTALDSGDPVISSITTTAANGTYGAGSIFDVTLHFSKPISLDGSIIVNFDTGGSCIIDAFGPPGALTASCSYTAGVGENSSDLSVASITTTGVTLTHPFGTLSDFVFTVLSEIADTRSIVIDTAAPAANTAPFLAASSDTGQSMSDNITNANPPVIGLACETDSVVKIYDTGRNLLGSANCAYQEIEGLSGDYAFVTLNTPLGDGSQTVFGTQTDLALNVSDDSPSFSFTVDTTPPVTSGAPVMTSGTGIITNDTTPTFTGSCTDGNTVAIFDDGTLSAGGYTCSSSAFSITSDTLASGSNSITFKETDVAANVSSASTPLVVTIDTTAPSTPSSAPDLASGSDSGLSTIDNTTSATTPTFTGTCTDVQVNLYVDGIFNTYVGCNSGNFSLPSTSLTNGTYDITYKETDALANESGSSPSLSITIDTTFPIISSIASSTITTTGITFTWTTDTSASSSIAYGLDASYGTISTSTESTSHSVILTGLSAGTTYHYNVLAVDTAGNISTSTDATFTTTAASPASSGGFSSTQTTTGGVTITTSNQIQTTILPTLNIASTTLQVQLASTTPTNINTVISATSPIFTTPTQPQSLQTQKQVFINPNGTPFIFTNTLTTTSPQNTDIQKLQVFLNSIGYIIAPKGPGSYGLETNKFGPATKNALLKFQKAAGIKGANGVFGPATRAYVNMILKSVGRN